MFDKEFLKKCLFSEGAGKLSDSIYDEFISAGEVLSLDADTPIIEPGKVDKSLYIIASGVSKVCYFDGKNDIVLGFGCVGTITISPLGFLMDKPSFCGFRTITKSDIIKIDHSSIINLINSSHEFSIWMFNIAVVQLCALELKIRLLSEGDIISNYKKLMETQMHPGRNVFQTHRENLLYIVSSKDIASYLGITQSYLSNIRKVIIEEERKKNNINSIK